MSFRTDNDDFEAWLAKHCDVVEEDIRYKHRQMKESAFIFLRATYFRWARKIGKWCPELMDAPQVLGVGDLHAENFGTWRDEDGRLVWGVNDFDEAAMMPYVLDLVRLAASIRLADELDAGNQAVARELLDGYGEGLSTPQPALLFEGETWLRDYAEPDKDEPEEFWCKVSNYAVAAPPAEVAKYLIQRLPEDVEKASVKFSQLFRKGMGSLGRPRYAAVAYWRGGRVLREAKALVPSAWNWAHGSKYDWSNFETLAGGPYRAPDPFLQVHGKYVFRRIGADAQKIELGTSPGKKLERKLVKAMGFDLASIHAADARGKRAILADLKKRPDGWLHAAAKTAAAAVEQDFEEWRG
jgi:Uncharacterized protein conserved in bacteria (DUF2252)